MGARLHRRFGAAACADASRLRLRRRSASIARFCALVSSSDPDTGHQGRPSDARTLKWRSTSSSLNSSMRSRRSAASAPLNGGLD